ncbi:MAG TPA: O-acetylhomoserine aminocarboxypropyltransferase/cysteine synthase [Candidatus Desulfovibrio intestinipullorum]|uniref:O-acetylhomoserine aminocarboxypropyltransferase/cysteine synthase n=1 Tax=Candidatus Desulfovibrio intestinipullorum TaxID=2838536 RepID=A0A9D1PVD5_9BACT|nr:O-acetylhomoserine aminocarboxypropyltransferase/cysteine synthase [Candidatus Desulfovibrio intestinipullorum]
MKIESQCIHGGYTPSNGEPSALPIYQSTTFRYTSTDEVAKLFDLEAAGFFYSRLANPTVDAVERKIAALEGGVAALATSSGQAAVFTTVVTIAKAGDHIVASSSIYGGTFNLLGTSLKRLGIDITFVNQKDSDEELDKAFRPNTKLVLGETLANPALTVLDIERFAKLAHRHNVPLVVDNTFATPFLCRPFEYGADIVVHSTTKYMDGHAIQLGGVIVDSGNFDWTCGNFPEFTEPDESYHGTIYTKAFGRQAFIVKARAQVIRDFGCLQTAQGAFYLDLGLQSLPVRMAAHCRNAEQVAAFLEGHEKVAHVLYPGLPSSPDHALAQKYLPRGTAGVISFTLKGGRDAGARFIDALKMIMLEVHVADIRTCVLHPASSTHRQLSDSQLVECGIEPGMVRLSVGLENVQDILDDLAQALDRA